MSSRLNPRDYDLGELRDAVGGRDRRRVAGRYDVRGPASLFDERSTERESPVDGGSDSSGDTDRGVGADRTMRGCSPRVNHDARDTSTNRRESARYLGASSRQIPGEGRTVGRFQRFDGRSSRPWNRAETRDEAVAGSIGGASDRGDGPSRRADRSPPRRDRSEPVADPRRRIGSGDRSGRRTARASADGPEFDLLYTGAGEDTDRPYLDRLPAAYGSQLTVFDWLGDLVAAAGREAARDALEYYESIGWISGTAREELAAFLGGLSAVEPDDRRPLDVADHRESLRYVAHLAGRRS